MITVEKLDVIVLMLAYNHDRESHVVSPGEPMIWTTLGNVSTN
jgi:hypothetical protein